MSRRANRKAGSSFESAGLKLTTFYSSSLSSPTLVADIPWDSFDPILAFSTVYHWFRPVRYRLSVLAGGDLLAVYGLYPYNYVNETYTPSIITTYGIMQLDGYVAYQDGARNIGRWSKWPSNI